MFLTWIAFGDFIDSDIVYYTLGSIATFKVGITTLEIAKNDILLKGDIFWGVILRCILWLLKVEFLERFSDKNHY